VRTDAIPTPRSADKTILLDGDDPYGNPPSKYDPIRWAYGPTHYEMGRLTTTLIFKTNQASEGLDLVARDRGHRLHNVKGDRQPRSNHLLPHCRHDATGRIADDDEGHVKLMSHRTVGESPSHQ
jgi:hypothetical protein